MCFYQILAAVLITAFLTFLICQRKSRVFRRVIGGCKTQISVEVTSDGDPAELEQSVKGLIWLISNGLLTPCAEIVINNSSVNNEVRQMSQILERDYAPVSVAK